MFHYRNLMLGCLLLLLSKMAIAAEPPDSDRVPVNHTIAVADFSGADPEVGRFISETLLTDLAQSPSLHFAERSEIRRALDELKLQATGLTDPEQVTKLGKLVSADRLIVGSYLEANDQIIINARLLDVETGRLSEGGAGNVTGDRRNLLSLVHRLAHQFHRRISGSDYSIDGEEDTEPKLPRKSGDSPPSYRSNEMPVTSSILRPPSSPASSRSSLPDTNSNDYRVKEVRPDSNRRPFTVPPHVTKPTRTGMAQKQSGPPAHSYRPGVYRSHKGWTFGWRIQ